MKFINSPIALAVLIAASGLFADFAMAATSQRYEPVRADRHEIVIEHQSNAVWPLYSRLCEYKTVMNNEDMHRCGVFLNIGPLPDGAVTRIDLRSIRTPR